MTTFFAGGENKRKIKGFFTFDRVFFGFALIVLVCSFVWTPKKKVAFKRNTIVFSQWWDAEMESGVLQNLIAEFEASNPAVNVKLDSRGKNDILRALREDGLSKGRLFDVVALDPYWVPELIQKNYLHNLDGLFWDDPVLEIEEASAGASVDDEYGRESGAFFAETDGLYAVPVVLFENFLFYNIDLLLASGFDRPPKTRENFYAMCKEISSGAFGVYGYAVSENVWTDCFPWLWQSAAYRYAAEDFNAGGVQPEVFFKDKEVRQTGAFLREINENRYLLPFPLSFNEDEKIRAFSSGRVAMMCAPVYAVNRIRALNGDLNFNLTAVPAPGAYSGKPVFNAQSWFAGIPSDSSQVDGAVIFLEFLNSKKSILAKAAGAIDRAEDVFTASPQERDELYAKAKTLTASADVLEDYFLFRDISLMENMLISNISVSDALN
ncbi:MAG: extracellular solute-binding protein [Spirochaetaceae bacterium]|jgi:multiple sugar transport system substrate-binding protein|nr:extracellular solute-binding protein [Spirochaetaceae bacterium]